MSLPEIFALAHRIGEVAGEPDSALTSELACLAELEPADDADRCIREALVWVLAGAEVAKAKCLTESHPHPKADESGAGESGAGEPKADEPRAAVLPSSRRGQLYLELARHGPIPSVNLVGLVF